MLALVLVHGVFWSGLLSASAAYLTHLLPERRRAEGISYWGLSSVAAIAVAPPVAFWIMQHGGWRWICISCGTLNLLMGVIACTLPEDRRRGAARCCRCRADAGPDARRVARPRAVADAVPLLVRLRRDHQLQRDVCGRARRLAQEHLSDDAGRRDSVDASAVGVRSPIGSATAACSCRACAYRDRPRRCCRRPRALTSLIVSAIVFGIGFGTAYPVFVAHVMRDISRVAPRRRVRRDPRGVRHRHRHGINVGRLADRAHRLSGRRSAWPPRSRPSRSPTSSSSIASCGTCEAPASTMRPRRSRSGSRRRR